MNKQSQTNQEMSSSSDDLPQESAEQADASVDSQEETKPDEIKLLKTEIEGLKDKLLRNEAELQTVRRRAANDIAQARRQGVERFATELLSVIDDLERALNTVDGLGDSKRPAQAQKAAIKTILDGIHLTHKNFVATLERFGITAHTPQGEAFDPSRHQAVSMRDSSEFEPGTVVEVIQKGYLVDQSLLRPAAVVVAQAREDEKHGDAGDKEEFNKEVGNEKD